jgi:serine/threonine protein phosphatase PrpC/LysM repeat protein
MENTTKISFSAVTHIGASCTVNDDRIYANGKFINHNAADYMQISIEVNDSKCLFALADGMEDIDSGISLINDLKKFHQKAKNSSKDIHVKLDDMVQCVEQSSNLLHSISLGDSDFRERKTAFSGLLIDEGNVAAVNLGSCRIYKLEGDTFKLLVNDFKRAERLLKMGIISNEQAELLSGQQKTSIEEGRTTVKKSDVNTLRPGVKYLICSGGLTDAVSEDAIYDLLSSNGNTDEAASLLVEEAVNNEGEDNITAIVIKIENSEDMPLQVAGPRASQMKAAKARKIPARLAEMRRTQNRVDAGKLVLMAVLVVLIAAVVFGAFKLWMRFRDPDAVDALGQENTINTTAESSTMSNGIDQTNETLPAENDSAVTDGAITADPNAQNPSDAADADLVGPDGTTYIVKSGDMLMKLAVKFYGDESKYKLIMEANDIKEADMIAVGQKLIIPPNK